MLYRVLELHTCGAFMFEAERDLVIEDIVIEPDGDSCVTLPIHIYLQLAHDKVKEGPHPWKFTRGHPNYQ